MTLLIRGIHLIDPMLVVQIPPIRIYIVINEFEMEKGFQPLLQSNLLLVDSVWKRRIELRINYCSIILQYQVRTKGKYLK